MIESGNQNTESAPETMTRHVKLDNSINFYASLGINEKGSGPDRFLDPANETNLRDVPRTKEEEIDIVFFKVGRIVRADEIEKLYEQQDLIPVDPYSLGQLNIQDKDFAGQCPNSTIYKDTGGQLCRASFRHYGGRRRVELFPIKSEQNFDASEWFAGVRNS